MTDLNTEPRKDGTIAIWEAPVSYKIETTVTVDGVTGTFSKRCNTLEEAQRILQLPNHYGAAFLTVGLWGKDVLFGEAFYLSPEGLKTLEAELETVLPVMRACDCTHYIPRRVDIYPGRLIPSVCNCSRCRKAIETAPKEVA